MNISKIESAWFQDQDLEAFMEEVYGIDIDEVICKAILEVEDAELHRIREVWYEQLNK